MYARSKIVDDGVNIWNATRLRLAVRCNVHWSSRYLFAYQKNGTFFPMGTGKIKENNWFLIDSKAIRNRIGA